VKTVEEDFANFLEDFCDFLNSLEEAVQKMKTQIGKLVGVVEKQKWDWNPDVIKWVKAEGSKGEFEKMLKDLAEHDGKLTRDGVFYWVFKNGSTVGRKKREVKP
jgi:hypothetical protein